MSKDLFMIHGMMLTGQCWGKYKDFFEKKSYQCHAPSLRHHQLFQREAPDYRLGTTSILDYVADLEAEIDQMPELPVLMGHSMGGLLAQILASRGKARALVLLAPAPPHNTVLLAPPSSLKSFSEVIRRWNFWKKPFIFSLEKTIYASLHLLSPEEQRAEHNKMVHESGKALLECGFPQLDTKKAADVPPHKVSCPVLILSGKEDRIVPNSVVRKIAERYPQAEFFEYENHAHWLLGEPGWEQIAEDIDQWLTRALRRNAVATSL